MDTPRPHAPPLTVDLSAVIVAVSGDEPRVLVLGTASTCALPSGPLEPRHRTLEAALRAWVEERTGQTLGYVEQLYTFGDRDRGGTPDAPHALSVAYLALVRQAREGDSPGRQWRDWYAFLPWEDWRDGRPDALARIEPALAEWVASAPDSRERMRREERVGLCFGPTWNDERVLERYELLYEAGLVPEAIRDPGARTERVPGMPMALDHRRMLATAIGRLRGKIKYRPVIFELMPESFTLLELQRTVEALAGARLHKQNFRRLVEAQGLVEETGEVASHTGGRPARLVRFRREVLVERPAPGVRLPTGRKSTSG